MMGVSLRTAASTSIDDGGSGAGPSRDDETAEPMLAVKRSGPLPADRERELVNRMRAGEEGAFETFAERYIPGLYRFARRRLENDRDLARELVQATVCRVIEKLDGYRAEAPLFTWLCACCRNEIAAHFRRAQRRPREVELDESASETGYGGRFAASPSNGPEEQMIQMETVELVHGALDLLPGTYARAIEWRYLEGLSVAEIALRLSSSYKATESLLSRAREAFREVFEHLGRGQAGAGVPGAFPSEGTKP
jgi:RNA polymerase sigma-70 factor, ECF subfamily